MAVKQAVVKATSYSGRSFVANGKTCYVHDVEFDNGDKGQYNSILEKQVKFVVGQSRYYSIEEKDNKGYKNFVIKPADDPNAAPQQSNTGGPAKTGGWQEDPKRQANIIAQSCIDKSIDFLKVTTTDLNFNMDDVEEHARQFIKMVKKLSDEQVNGQ